MRISAIAAAAAMSLLVGGASLPAHAAVSIEYLTHTTSCLGLLLSDPAAHASTCGVAPDGDDVESLSPEGGGEPDEESEGCSAAFLDLKGLAPGERLHVAAVGPCDVY